MGEKCEPLYCICICRIPQRIVVAILCALSIFLVYGQRSAMAGVIYYVDYESPPGLMFGVLHAGYLIGHIPAGVLVDRYSVRCFFLFGILISTVITFLTPVLAVYAPWYVVLIMVLILSISQSVMYPSIAVLISRWIPFPERSTLGALAFASEPLAMTCGFFTKNLFGDTCDDWLDWQWFFYLWGILGILWCIPFFLFVFDSPKVHPHITQTESDFLRKHVRSPVRMSIPGRMMKNMSVWSILFGQMGHDLPLQMMTTELLVYFANMTDVITQIYLFPAVIMVLLWVSAVACGVLIDYGIREKDWNIKWTRRAPTYIAYAVPGLCLVILGHVDNSIAAYIFFTIAAIFKGPHYASFRINQMDINLNFNGFIMGLTMTFGYLISWPARMVNRLFFYNWHILSYKSLIFGFAFMTTYFCTAKVERAEWDVPANDEEADND